jgi:hypothetical protein
VADWLTSPPLTCSLTSVAALSCPALVTPPSSPLPRHPSLVTPPSSPLPLLPSLVIPPSPPLFQSHARPFVYLPLYSLHPPLSLSSSSSPLPHSSPNLVLRFLANLIIAIIPLFLYLPLPSLPQKEGEGSIKWGRDRERWRERGRRVEREIESEKGRKRKRSRQW